MKTQRWILTIVLVLILSIPAMSANAASLAQLARSAAISLTAPTPDPGPVGSDVNFSLVITDANIVPGVAGADVFLGYDPAMVTPPANPTGGVEFLTDFFGFSSVNIAEVLPAASCPGGDMPCIHLVVAGQPRSNGSGVVARFHFRALVPGQTCFTILDSRLVDADGFTVDHTVGADSCVNLATILAANGTVKRQGVAVDGSLACSIVTGTGSGVLGPINTTSNGGFQLTGLVPGSYTLRAVYPGYLTSQLILPTTTITPILLPTTTLRGGDVNGDGAINILDIGAIISKFGRTGVAVKSTSVNCSVSDEPADINDDTNINISDLAIAAGNWGLVAPTTWP